jgi:hypothetical protein
MNEQVIVPGKRLGKAPKKHDPRTLRLANYVGALPTLIPKARRTTSWGRKTQVWPMLRNDEVGDCTIVSALHMQQAWRDNVGTDPDYVVTDEMALEGYMRICGYDPAVPDTDQGGVVLDVLSAWRREGIGGRKMDAFASVDRQRHNLVKLAVDWFGGLYIGAGLPVAAMEQKLWDVQDAHLLGDAEPFSWGGHAMNVVAYDDHVLSVVTWGARQKMTWRWWDAYVDEAYCIISCGDWLNEHGASPRGLNLDELMADLKLVTKR